MSFSGSTGVLGPKPLSAVFYVTQLSDCCQHIRWFIIPIRPIRGNIEEYGLVSGHRETLVVPRSDRINFRLIAASSPPAVLSFRSVGIKKKLNDVNLWF